MRQQLSHAILLAGLVTALAVGSAWAQGGTRSSGEGSTKTYTVPGQSVTPQGVPGTTTPPVYPQSGTNEGPPLPGQSVTPSGVPGTTGTGTTTESLDSNSNPVSGGAEPDKSVTPSGVPGTTPNR